MNPEESLCRLQKYYVYFYGEAILSGRHVAACSYENAAKWYVREIDNKIQKNGIETNNKTARVVVLKEHSNCIGMVFDVERHIAIDYRATVVPT